MQKTGRPGKKKKTEKGRQEDWKQHGERPIRNDAKSIIARWRERNVQNRGGIAVEDASSTKRNTGDTGKTKG